MAEDGEAYSKAEFAEYYGGSAEWDRAPRAPPPAATAAAAVLASRATRGERVSSRGDPAAAVASP